MVTSFRGGWLFVSGGTLLEWPADRPSSLTSGLATSPRTARSSPLVPQRQQPSPCADSISSVTPHPMASNRPLSFISRSIGSWSRRRGGWGFSLGTSGCSSPSPRVRARSKRRWPDPGARRELPRKTGTRRPATSRQGTGKVQPDRAVDPGGHRYAARALEPVRAVLAHGGAGGAGPDCSRTGRGPSGCTDRGSASPGCRSGQPPRVPSAWHGATVTSPVERSQQRTFPVAGAERRTEWESTRPAGQLHPPSPSAIMAMLGPPVGSGARKIQFPDEEFGPASGSIVAPAEYRRAGRRPCRSQ